MQCLVLGLRFVAVPISLDLLSSVLQRVHAVSTCCQSVVNLLCSGAAWAVSGGMLSKVGQVTYRWNAREEESAKKMKAGRGGVQNGTKLGLKSLKERRAARFGPL